VQHQYLLDAGRTFWVTEPTSPRAKTGSKGARYAPPRTYAYIKDAKTNRLACLLEEKHRSFEGYGLQPVRKPEGYGLHPVRKPEGYGLHPVRKPFAMNTSLALRDDSHSRQHLPPSLFSRAVRYAEGLGSSPDLLGSASPGLQSLRKNSQVR
jgi:hypothetical protein